jgi:hypothetical protein
VFFSTGKRHKNRVQGGNIQEPARKGVSMSKDVSQFFKQMPGIPPEDVVRIFELFLKYRNETEITKREVKRYDSIKEVMLREISRKYDFYQDFFTRIFAERKEIINKNFEIIDQGMKAKDQTLISSGLSNLSNMVASGPFADLSELHRLLGANQNIEF